MRVNEDKATHAIIGYHPLAGAGILFWHDEEFAAWRDCRDLKKDGGFCRVISIQDLPEHKALIRLLVTDTHRRSLVAHWG